MPDRFAGAAQEMGIMRVMRIMRVMWKGCAAMICPTGTDCAYFYPHGLFLRRRDFINLIVPIIPITLIKRAAP